MGRSFLSVKLAAVFGLLVAGAVTAQQQLGDQTAPLAPSEVRLVQPEQQDCEERINGLAHTPRAKAPAPAPAAAARS